MPPRSRAGDKWKRSTKPEDMPIEVRPHVQAIYQTQQIIDSYALIFDALPSFRPLFDRFDQLNGVLDEILAWVKTYLDGEIGFKEFEHEMGHLLAEGLENSLDHYPENLQVKRGDHPLEDVDDVPLVANRVQSSHGESDEEFEPIKQRTPMSSGDQGLDDIEEVMTRVWDAIRIEGYKLHTAMIMA